MPSLPDVILLLSGNRWRVAVSCVLASTTMAKDVKQPTQHKAEPTAAEQPIQPTSSAAATEQRQQAPLLLPSTVINLAVHSLLMITVPFVLFFATSYGALDCKRAKDTLHAAAASLALVNTCLNSGTVPAALFTVTGAPVPRQEVKYYIGAGLAVLGVNLVRTLVSSTPCTLFAIVSLALTQHHWPLFNSAACLTRTAPGCYHEKHITVFACCAYYR